MHFDRGLLESMPFTQRNDSLSRCRSSQRRAGDGVVWHRVGLAFRALKLCQIEPLA